MTTTCIAEIGGAPCPAPATLTEPVPLCDEHKPIVLPESQDRSNECWLHIVLKGELQ